MFCGTGSFKHVDEEPCGGRTSPKAAAKNKPGKANPYAGRGLDKYSTVLSELESRREKIMQRVGSGGGLVMVRFVQSDAKGWVPVVVKLPEPTQDATDDAKKSNAKSTAAAAPGQPLPPPPQPASPKERGGKHAVKAVGRAAAPTRKFSRPFSWRQMRWPSWYWPLAMALVLVSLVVFGRVFAICCTSIWWYLLPTLSSGGACEDGQSLRRASMAKGKDFERRASDRKMEATHAKKGISGVHGVTSPRSHAHAHGKRTEGGINA